MKYSKIVPLLGGMLFGSSQVKYESKFEVLRYVSKKMGFRLYNKNLAWIDDEEYKKVWSGFSQSDNNIHERRFTLYNLAKSVSGIDGDTAECGVFYGAGSYLIMAANKGLKQHHIFDSFEGLSRPEFVDEASEDYVAKWAEGDLEVAEHIVKSNLGNFEHVKFYKGWIPERFPEVGQSRFSFVHIDVDLYQPTLDSFEFFYDRLAVGGVMACDDYGSTQCPSAYKAFNDFVLDKPEEIAHLTTGTGFIIKQ